ncbi:MAG: zinc ribbon domain-containing protein [Dehalococcoidia bacterium]|nr:zinc ribbon domain-containing protein [Dehalococcoidia bacterium]
MRISNFIKGRHAAGFFRICLVIIIALTLAAGGIVVDSAPAQADIVVSPDPTNVSWQECVHIAPITFTHGPSANPPPLPGWPPEVFFFWTVGALPPGISLDTDTGVLSGCPDPGTGGTAGSFSIGCTALVPVPFSLDFSSSPAVVNWDIIAPPPCDMVIDPVFYPVAWENMPYSMNMTVSGGVGPFFWSAAGLPVGLSVTDPVNGTISGIPVPGTCGIYTVTATCTDNGTCCCPPVDRPFIFIVDCWANYVFLIPAISSCDFNVAIGPGLTAGQTQVLINGQLEATLSGGTSGTFTSYPCQSNLVMVDETLPGTDPSTRFAVVGLNYKMVNDTDNYAYFDYARQVLIETASNPGGIVQPPGTGFYTVGSSFSSTAPSPVDSSSQQGERYVFREWRLPDGSPNPNRDLFFTVTSPGMASAEYNTYYLLNIVSDYPAAAESSWELKDSDAAYSLALQPVPIPNFWGLLGGVMKPVNSSGTHVMTGPYTLKIQWVFDYTVPIIIFSVIALLIIGLVVLFVILGKRSGRTAAAAGASKPPAAAAEADTTPVAPVAVEKKALTEAEAEDRPNFCPKCGASVEKDSVFCKKCGNKLVKNK